MMSAGKTGYGVGMTPSPPPWSPFLFLLQQNLKRPSSGLVMAAEGCSNLRPSSASFPPLIFSMYSSPLNMLFGGGSSSIQKGGHSHYSPENGASVYGGGSSSGARKFKIGIVGGGLAGTTAAASITSSAVLTGKIETTVFEEDSLSEYRNHKNSKSDYTPHWHAAAAKNANAIVPGASMNIMSQRKAVAYIMFDSIKQWFELQFERLDVLTNHNHIKNIDNFEKAPPYFAFHLLHCIGPSSTSAERKAFLNFFKNYLITSMKTGSREARERSHYLVGLTRANRSAIQNLAKIDNENSKDGDLSDLQQVNRGFLAMNRKKESAENSEKEVMKLGEKASLLTKTEAAEMEPKLKRLPIENLYAVYRPNDIVSNCALFVQNLVPKLIHLGVTYLRGDAGSVKRLEIMNQTSGYDNRSKFRVHTNDGRAYDFDILILAAGCHTPLLAAQMSAQKYCPTFPLRGWSLTVNPKVSTDGKSQSQENRSDCSLSTSFSIDSIYVTSVGNITRLTGLGEIAGFPKQNIPTSVGPSVLTRYRRALFPESDDMTSRPIDCYRPYSPDDLPIAGACKDIPGLILHTGHGTLGWSSCSATSECVAQSVAQSLNLAETKDYFELSDGTAIPQAVLSPNRFI